MKYEKILPSEAISLFPQCINISFSTDDKLFISPVKNPVLRARCLFEIAKGPISEIMSIFIHLTNEEKIAQEINLPVETIYFYGVYGDEVYTYQMKSKGFLREMEIKEKDVFIRLVTWRFLGAQIGDPVDIDKNLNKKIDALLQSGNFYFFEPRYYEFKKNELKK